ncbi:glycogen/starch synthase [soil metagenome]
MRVLFVAGEVAPFSATTQTAALIRHLPEHLQESHGVEPRILMPRYGTVSERRNRLHEVIRLSGDDVSGGTDSDILKVKVASIPGIRLQVYFMDSNRFFKRKGVVKDRKSAEAFEDNASRALFFARAALTTVSNLGWSPEIVHCSSLLGSLVPVVVKREKQAEGDLFRNTKVVFTPDEEELSVPLPEAIANELGVPEQAGVELRDIGRHFADAVAFEGEGETDVPEEIREMADRAHSLYESLTSGVAA